MQGYNQPFVFANALFFFNVTVGFWLIGLLNAPFGSSIRTGQSSSAARPSLPIPPQGAVRLVPLGARARIAGLVSAPHAFVLSARGVEVRPARRLALYQMAADYPKLFLFFAVGLAQQPMLLGISAPALAAHTDATPFGLADVLCALGCVAGLAVAPR